MIPDTDPEPRPPLTLEFVFMLALLAPLIHLLWQILLQTVGLRLGVSAYGMSALVTYGGLVALCAPRFRLPPARELAFVPAPSSAWLAALFLTAGIIVSSEIDNVVKSLVPPPAPLPPDSAGTESAMIGPALALVYIGVLPLCFSVFFRGMFQPLAAARLGVIPGVLLTAVFSGFADGFVPALIHGGLWDMVPLLLNALVLAILRQCSGSVLPTLLLQSLWGAAQVCAQYRVFGLAGFDGAGHTPMLWVGGAALLTVVGFALCRAAARSGADAGRSAAQG
jgi:CAAX prenyl protease-like protein